VAQGEILHRDTLGYAQVIRPGQLNVMTAGRGIAHSEESPTARPPGLHGAQLWIALPEADRHCEPAFDHHPQLPVLVRDRVTITLLAGEALGERSPARIYTPLRPDFEHGVLVLEGSVSIENEPLAIGHFLYLGCGRDKLTLSAVAATRVLLLGGMPFAEEVLLWWNFVARSKTEINAARADWENNRFGEVRGYPGTRIPAPPLPWA